MHTTHSSVTEFLTARFALTTPATDPESSQSRGREAEAKAHSLSRLLGNVLRRVVGRAPVLTQEEQLIREIRRLRELSPHLLSDIGVTTTLEDTIVVAAPYPTPDETPAAAAKPDAQPRPARTTGLLAEPQAAVG